jgi:hypothetical protein
MAARIIVAMHAMQCNEYYCNAMNSANNNAMNIAMNIAMQ